jgi:hypothetical protein
MDANCTAEEDSGSVEDMAGDEMLITRCAAKGMALTWVRAWTASEDDRCRTGFEQVLGCKWCRRELTRLADMVTEQACRGYDAWRATADLRAKRVREEME